MKNIGIILILIFVIGSPSLVIGQKLRDKAIKINHVAIPDKVLPESYTTFAVNVFGYSHVAANLSRTDLAQSIDMDYFARKEYDNAHLRLSINTDRSRPGELTRESEVRTTKDKDGNEVRTTYYWYNLPMSFDGGFNIYDVDGQVLESKGVPISRVVKSREYTSYSSLSRNRNGIYRGIISDFAKSSVRNLMSSARRSLVDNYDFNQKGATEQLYFIKKHGTEKKFTVAFELAEKILGDNETFCKSSSELESELESVIAYWKQEASKSPGSDKKAQKVYKAAAYNLAITHYYLDDLDSAEKYANAVIRSEGKDRRSKLLIRKISESREKMKLHNVNTMHYCRDISNVIGPDQVAALEEEKEALEKDNISNKGSIVLNGKEINGSFLQSKDSEQMLFGNDGTVKFLVQSDDDLVEYDLTDENITSFTLGDRKFKKTMFAPSAKGKTESRICVMEIVYSSDQINLYEYHPSSGVLGDVKSELAFQKDAGLAPISLHDTQFLIWKKGIAKYFSDCADLSEMCSNGDIEMDRDDLIKAARIYSEVCNGSDN